MSRKKMIAIFFVAILIFLSGCNFPIPRHSILDSSNCEFPCWNNAILGRTSPEEFEDILHNLDIVDQNSIVLDYIPNDENSKTIFFDIYLEGIGKNKPKIYADANFLSDKLGYIGFSGSTNTSVGKIIEKFGNPTNVWIRDGGGGIGGYGIYLINYQKNMAFEFPTRIPFSFKPEVTSIKSEITIYHFLLIEKDAFQNVFINNFYCGVSCSAELASKNFFPWKGYGKIDEKYPYTDPQIYR